MPRTVAGGGVERTDVAKIGNGNRALTGGSDSLTASNNARVGLFVSNPGAANKMFVSLGAAAANNVGIMIPPGQTVYIPGFTGAVNIFGTAADQVAFCEI